MDAATSAASSQCAHSAHAREVGGSGQGLAQSPVAGEEEWELGASEESGDKGDSPCEGASSDDDSFEDAEEDEVDDEDVADDDENSAASSVFWGALLMGGRLQRSGRGRRGSSQDDDDGSGSDDSDDEASEAELLAGSGEPGGEGKQAVHRGCTAVKTRSPQKSVEEFQNHQLAQETRMHTQPRLRRGREGAQKKKKTGVEEAGPNSNQRKWLKGKWTGRAGRSGKDQGAAAGAVQIPRHNSLLLLLNREANGCRLSKFSPADRSHMANGYLPRDGPTVIDSMRSRAYIGQFSADGTLFVAGFQDRRIRLYDVDRGWALRKDVFARNLRWTVTDTALSPNQQFLIYASINPVVHQVNVVNGSSGVESHANVTDIHEELNFCQPGSGGAQGGGGFGIWALQYSADGTEIVAGTSDESFYIYDMEKGKSVLRVRGHDDDVNAVAFADSSSNLIFTGSDDHFCKVWDRRALGPRRQAVGVMVGHCEGITHICSKGDGRHFISNGKDQTIKLWDIRNMHSPSGIKALPKVRVPSFRWDYRWMDYPGRGKNLRHPHDHSVMSYQGHHVLQTLIRCYFSPEHSTGQRFIYTGSHDGSVYIFDVLTGEVVTQLKYHGATVRDCSWHPFYPQLVSTAWDGRVAHWEFLAGERPPQRLIPKYPSSCPDADDRMDQYDW